MTGASINVALGLQYFHPEPKQSKSRLPYSGEGSPDRMQRPTKNSVFRHPVRIRLCTQGP